MSWLKSANGCEVVTCLVMMISEVTTQQTNNKQTNNRGVVTWTWGHDPQKC